MEASVQHTADESLYIVVKLPLEMVYERLFLSRAYRSPFVRQASWFEDVVVRCVRYAFAYIPANIGRVFFSKPVLLPFWWFRMLRHGYVRSPIHWEEIIENTFTGIWIIQDRSQDPDIVIYYAHGGGFSLGSSYFYLEFLLAFITLLTSTKKFKNPAILALEYTLVPEASYPTQLHQAISGYKYLLSYPISASKIVVGGDSAGATLILSLLLHLGSRSSSKETPSNPAIQSHMETPGMAVLISPWVTLMSPKYQNTPSDYLNADSLHEYARQYAGLKISPRDAFISPGDCKELSTWRNAAPTNGFHITYGSEEVFQPEIKDFITLLDKSSVRAQSREEKGRVHAWPVTSLFLDSTGEERTRGLRGIVEAISESMAGENNS